MPKGKSKGKEAKRLVWTTEAEKSFIATKQLLAKHLEFFICEADRPFHMETDTSDFSIGATLKQCDNDLSPTSTAGTMYPDASFSRKLQTSHQNQSPREKDAYTMVSSRCKWDPWIRLQPVTVHSEHHSLRNWPAEVVDTLSSPSGRKERWHELLSKFNLTVLYITGKD